MAVECWGDTAFKTECAGELKVVRAGCECRHMADAACCFRHLSETAKGTKLCMRCRQDPMNPHRCPVQVLAVEDPGHCA